MIYQTDQRPAGNVNKLLNPREKRLIGIRGKSCGCREEEHVQDRKSRVEENLERERESLYSTWKRRRSDRATFKNSKLLHLFDEMIRLIDHPFKLNQPLLSKKKKYRSRSEHCQAYSWIEKKVVQASGLINPAWIDANHATMYQDLGWPIR